MFSFYNQEATLGRFLRSRFFSLAVVLAFVIATVLSLSVSTAKAVEVNEEGQTRVIYIHSDSESDILLSAGVTGDQDYQLEKVGNGYKLTVGKKFNVTVFYGDEVKTVETFACNVAAVLGRMGVVIDDECVVEPSIDTKLSKKSAMIPLLKKTPPLKKAPRRLKPRVKTVLKV